MQDTSYDIKEWKFETSAYRYFLFSFIIDDIGYRPVSVLQFLLKQEIQRVGSTVQQETHNRTMMDQLTSSSAMRDTIVVAIFWTFDSIPVATSFNSISES